MQLKFRKAKLTACPVLDIHASQTEEQELTEIPPTLSIFGFKDSGKTTIASAATEHFTSQGLRVLAVKHVGKPNFSLDHEGTDSHRFTIAGASVVLLHSDSSTALLIPRPIKQLALLLQLGLAATSADVVILEGFKSWTRHHPEIAKVICLRSDSEVQELSQNIQGEVLATCTLTPGVTGALLIPDQLPMLLQRLDDWLANATPFKME
jgi:molybdopterin-guanine dinucleotide biosynthesis protein B